jgi:hypothetical protein
LTKLKIDGSPAHAAASALDPHVQPLYTRLGATRVAVVELRPVERTQVAQDSGKDPAVKARITHCEVATGESEQHLREVLKALHTVRTAAARDEGMLDAHTLDFDRTVDLADSTIKQAAGLVMVEEKARLVTGVRQLRRVLSDLASRDLPPAKWRDKVREVADYAKRLEQLAEGLDSGDPDDQ